MVPDLPPWTVAADIDLRSWLFAFGGGIRIDRPDGLRQELVERCRQEIEANRSSESPTTVFSQRRRSRPDGEIAQCRLRISSPMQALDPAVRWGSELSTVPLQAG